jgi:UDP:flavonoid glycosyltransferase YjiC (YdhE family)
VMRLWYTTIGGAWLRGSQTTTKEHDLANILFVTWDGGGNLPPAIGIAAELQRRGDAVRFLGHEQQRNVIEKAGLRFEPYSEQHGFSTTTPESWVRWVRSLLAFCWQGTPRPAQQTDGDPRVLVSLSSVFFPGQERVLQNVLDAVGGLPVRTVVTTGAAVSAGQLHVPANVELHSYLPHVDLLPTVSLVIGHGGHATTMAASRDLPIIVLPMAKFMDQHKIGQALEKAGAGCLLPKRSSPARIRTAIEQVLGDDRYRLAASRLGAEIRKHDGASAAADAMAQVLAQSRQT